MSKESSSREATQCACGGTFAFMEYHWPHCQFNPVNLGKQAHEEPHGMGAKLLKSLQAKFSKSELEQVAKQGPMADKPIGKKRGKRPVKAGAKR